MDNKNVPQRLLKPGMAMSFTARLNPCPFQDRVLTHALKPSRLRAGPDDLTRDPDAARILQAVELERARSVGLTISVPTPVGSAKISVSWSPGRYPHPSVSRSSRSRCMFLGRDKARRQHRSRRCGRRRPTQDCRQHCSGAPAQRTSHRPSCQARLFRPSRRRHTWGLPSDRHMTPVNAKPPAIVTVACKTAIFGKFVLGVTCAGTVAETSKTTTIVDAPPVNTFRTIARSDLPPLAKTG